MSSLTNPNIYLLKHFDLNTNDLILLLKYIQELFFNHFIYLENVDTHLYSWLSSESKKSKSLQVHYIENPIVEPKQSANRCFYNETMFTKNILCLVLSSIAIN